MAAPTLAGQSPRVSADSKRHTHAFWKRVVAELDRGASIASAAERHGVSPKTLVWWRWRLRRDEKATGSARLLPVVLRAEPTRVVAEHPEPIAITLRDDLTLRVPIGSDVGYVAALLITIRRTC